MKPILFFVICHILFFSGMGHSHTLDIIHPVSESGLFDPSIALVSKHPVGTNSSSPTVYSDYLLEINAVDTLTDCLSTSLCADGFLFDFGQAWQSRGPDGRLNIMSDNNVALLLQSIFGPSFEPLLHAGWKMDEVDAPEPAPMVLFGIGLIALAGIRRNFPINS